MSLLNFFLRREEISFIFEALLSDEMRGLIV
jgi:hypothetical protein